MTTKRPVLILIHGVPGAGKTTLARRLAADTDLPVACKDDLKEFFFDTLGVRDRDWSRMLGGAVSDMLYLLTDTLMRSGNNLILENAFYRSFAIEALGKIIKAHNVRCLEIYCHLDPDERRRRFIARSESGQRHVGHVDTENYGDLNDETALQVYAPLGIGEILRVDTTHFGESEYKRLQQDVIAFINSH